MSLFPAYSATTEPDDEVPSCSTSNTNTQPTEWLENTSFPLQEHQIKSVQEPSSNRDSIASSTSESSDSDQVELEVETLKKPRLDQKKKKKKDKQETENEEILKSIDFHGDEEYYVDKKPSKQYKIMDTLHKPVCPRYKRTIKKPIGNHRFKYGLRKKSSKRYYRQKVDDTGGKSKVAMSEDEFKDKVGALNRKTIETPLELKPWVDLILLQDENPYKLSKLLLAERKLEMIQKALIYHPKNEKLYYLYIDIINSTYPSFEVSKLIDRLLSKDPFNYILWTAQILATQCSMARCIVPDVLKIYERCMQKMHFSMQRNDRDSSDDAVMLKLFNNCALFLRQAGLNEQFFALIKLALELNVSTDKIDKMEPLDQDQNTLIEYEELILQSGLPMNEIWLRIESLRQAFNFLPLPLNAQCSDPQRIVFNEDICHYIYPLKSRENSFYLILLILRLLKVPFVHCDVLAETFCARVENIGDSDAIEDALAAFLHRSFTYQNFEFLVSLYELTKEMAVSPTYINSSIGHELYIRCITQLLLNCASAYEGIDETKRVVLLLIWCRFERVLLMLQKCSNKLTPDYVKAGRTRFKAILKQKSNRNVVHLYTEFALYEFEASGIDYGDMQKVQNIFDNLISANDSVEEASASALCFACVSYVEILISKDNYNEALHILICYILKTDSKKSRDNIGSAKKLSALHAISEKLDNLIALESNVEIMVLEQYFLPDYTISLLKMKILLQYLIGQTLEALSYLEKLLKIFKKGSTRHRFIREQLYEQYLVLLKQKREHCNISNSLISTKISEALSEFPRNIFFLQCCGVSSLPWYKLRTIMLVKTPSVISIVFLIAAARYRFIKRITQSNNTTGLVLEWDLKHNEIVVRNRILNTFKALTNTSDTEMYNKCSEIRRNSLFWRLYLCCLSDTSTAFETTKKCLLTALDECPWSKALYIDGATYVPQELTHLQDLIIEKHMRIYALPDELEILREK